jgi:hypothetical protein
MNAPRLSRWTLVVSVLAVASVLGVARDPWPAAAQTPNPFDPATFAVGLELALRIAEETDARVAALPLERMAPLDPESPIWPAHGEHRGEHLDELERALRDRG